ncbi:hypothetical protein F4825DRAFT_433897 [Nemania diffusa]|nr:hypothetical protein F4825DRAFT_433897 [Nemania diffusa]
MPAVKSQTIEYDLDPQLFTQQAIRQKHTLLLVGALFFAVQCLLVLAIFTWLGRLSSALDFLADTHDASGGGDPNAVHNSAFTDGQVEGVRRYNSYILLTIMSVGFLINYLRMASAVRRPRLAGEMRRVDIEAPGEEQEW